MSLIPSPFHFDCTTTDTHSHPLYLLTEGVFKLKPSLADNVSKYDPNHGPPAGLITPIIVSSLILMAILLIGCVLCSKETLYARRCVNNQRNHESGERRSSEVPLTSASALLTLTSHSPLLSSHHPLTQFHLLLLSVLRSPSLSRASG